MREQTCRSRRLELTVLTRLEVLERTVACGAEGELMLAVLGRLLLSPSQVSPSWMKSSMLPNPHIHSLLEKKVTVKAYYHNLILLLSLQSLSHPWGHNTKLPLDSPGGWRAGGVQHWWRDSSSSSGVGGDGGNSKAGGGGASSGGGGNGDSSPTNTPSILSHLLCQAEVHERVPGRGDGENSIVFIYSTLYLSWLLCNTPEKDKKWSQLVMNLSATNSSKLSQ